MQTTEKVSLAECVRQEINAMPHIKSSLSDGVVNYSALARMLMPSISEKTGKKLNEESVIVSIKRYADELVSSPGDNAFLETFANSEIALQDNMAYVYFKKNDRVVSKVEKLFTEENWNLGEVRIFIHGAEQIMLIAKKNRLQEIVEELSNEKIFCLFDKSLVSIRMPLESHSLYGIIAEIPTILSKKGVSVELVSSPPDLHFLVDEKDAEKTYVTLRQLVKEARSKNK